MSAYTNSPAAGTGGFHPDVNEVRVIVRGKAASRGEVMVLDDASSDPNVDSNRLDERSIHRNVIEPDTINHQRYGKPVIMLDDTGEDREGRAARGGQVMALCTRSDGSEALPTGTPLSIATNGTLNASLTATHKVVAKLAAAVTLDGTAKLVPVVLSDSDGGFGTVITP